MDIHEKLIEIYSNFKENNEHDMATHGIRFDFQPSQQMSKTGQNAYQAAADAHLAVIELPQL